MDTNHSIRQPSKPRKPERESNVPKGYPRRQTDCASDTQALKRGLQMVLTTHPLFFGNRH